MVATNGIKLETVRVVKLAATKTTGILMQVSKKNAKDHCRNEELWRRLFSLKDKRKTTKLTNPIAIMLKTEYTNKGEYDILVHCT